MSAQPPIRSTPFNLAVLGREEAPFIAVAATFLIFQFGADALLERLSTPLAGVLLIWLVGVALWAAFGVVRHADILAIRLGEPYGTLILTISVIGIEVSLIAAVMLTGEDAPTLARDTMFAVLMIVLNGLVGLALLIGGLRHSEQDYSLQGARAYLSVLLPLAVFALVLPILTISTEDPTFTKGQALFLSLATILLYGVFVGIQTTRHRTFFEQPKRLREDTDDGSILKDEHHDLGMQRSLGFHSLMLVLTLLPIVLLSKRIARLLDYGIVEVGAPAELGGLLIALIVLTPEALAALEAAAANRLQRSVNLMLGSALATIGLTLPAVLGISLLTDEPVTLGLEPAPAAILLLTLVISTMTFGGARTNMLQGAVHLILFFAYVMLIFSP